MGYSNSSSTSSSPNAHEPQGSVITRDILADLQNKNVIAVALGDYHFGALTAEGHLLTWGKYQAGSLGLGDPAHIPVGESGGFATREAQERHASGAWGLTPPEVKTPTRVMFSKKESRYCFAAVAAGWHFGALVLDVDGQVDDDDDSARPEGFPGGGDGPPGGYTLPIQRGGAPFHRVGFAGRGAFRGGAAGRVLGQIPDQLNMM